MFILDNKEKEYTLIGSAPNGMVEKMDKGVYNLVIVESSRGVQIKFTKNNDYKKGIKLNQGVFKNVRDFFNDFFSKSKIEARNILDMKHKLGVIFTGDPGTGKTFLAGQLAEEICESYDAISILVTKYSDYSGLIDDIRMNDKDRLIVLIIDELEKTFKSYDTDALSFLSGAKERDNLIIIATVNDSSQLPSFIKDRPSRFEEEFNFSFNDEVVLKSIVENMIPKNYTNEINMTNLVNKIKKHKNKSIDRIRHIIRDVIANNIESKKTGIKKELIIKDSPNIKNRTVVSGFSRDESSKGLMEQITPKTIFQEFDWGGLDTYMKELCSN